MPVTVRGQLMMAFPAKGVAEGYISTVLSGQADHTANWISLSAFWVTSHPPLHELFLSPTMMVVRLGRLRLLRPW